MHVPGKVLAGVIKCKLRQYGPLSITFGASLPWQCQQACVQLPTSADNVALPAFAAERRAAAAPAMQQSIDIACRLDPQQQTRRSGDRKLGQTKTRTDLDIDTAPHSTRACKFTMEGGACTLMLSDGRRCSVSRVHRCSKVPGMLTKTIQCV